LEEVDFSDEKELLEELDWLELESDDRSDLLLKLKLLELHEWLLWLLRLTKETDE